MGNPFARKKPEVAQAGNTCPHPSHKVKKEATGDDRGGFIRKCGECGMEWWTPN